MRRGYSRSLEDEDGSFPVLGHNGGQQQRRQRRQRSQRRLLVPNPFKCASPGCSNNSSPHRFDSAHQGNVRERRYIPPSEDVLVNSFHSKEPTTPVTPSTLASSDTYHLYDGEFRDGNDDDDDVRTDDDKDTSKTENAPESPKAVVVVPNRLLVPTPKTPVAVTTETPLLQVSDDTETAPDATRGTENVDPTAGTGMVDTTKRMDATKEIPDPVTAPMPLEQGEPSTTTTTTTTDNETNDTLLLQDGKDHERNKDGALDELERVEQDNNDGGTRGVETPGEDAPAELLEQETTVETDDDEVVGERDTPVQELLGRLDRLNTILTTQETRAQERLDSQLGEGSVQKLDEETGGTSRSRPSPDASSYTTFSSFTLADVAETGSMQQPPPPPPPRRSDSSKPVTPRPFFWRSHPSVTHTFYGQPPARQTRMALLRRGKAKKPPTAKKPPKPPPPPPEQKPSLTSAYLQQAKVDFPALPEDATTLERSLQSGYISGSDESHNWVEGSNWLAVPPVTDDDEDNEDSSIYNQ